MKTNARFSLFILALMLSLVASANDIGKLRKKLAGIPTPQAKIDSAWLYCNDYVDNEEEEYLLNEIVANAKQTGNKKCMAKAFRSLARNQYNKLDYKDTISYFVRQIESLNLRDPESRSWLADTKSFECMAYIYGGHVDKALDIANEFLETARKDNDKYAAVTANEVLGLTYQRVLQFDKAGKFLEDAYATCKELPDQTGYKSQLILELSDFYILSDQHQKLKTTTHELRELLAVTDSAKYGFYTVCRSSLESYSAIYDLSQNQPDKAWQHIQESRKYRKQGYSNEYLAVLRNYAIVKYYMQKDRLDKAYEIVKDVDANSTELFFQVLIDELLEKMGKWEELARMRKGVVDQYRDVFHEELGTQLTQMHTKFDVYNLEMNTAKAELAQQEMQTKFFILTTVFVLILVILLVVSFWRMHKDKKKIEKANQTQKAFLQNMSHEIRTPLNAICGFAQILSTPQIRQMISDDEMQEYGSIITSNTDMLSTLVNDILDISDLDSNKYRLNIGICKVDAICQGAMNTVRYRCPDSIKLYATTDLPEGYEINSDSQRCQQIIINFLTNAIKHTSQGEIHIHTSLTERPGYVAFSVTDTGEGVPADKAEVIFGRFEKLNTFKQGTGLGLNIVLRLSQLMHGDAYLDTSYTDGARFVFIHPVINS